MSNFMTIKNAYSNVLKEQAENTDETDSAPIEYEFRLSNDICDELTKTVNSFTATCAKIVKRRGADAELFDRFQNSYAKIKNLIDAARNTNLKNR